jgi:hypothetical protein
MLLPKMKKWVLIPHVRIGVILPGSLVMLGGIMAILLCLMPSVVQAQSAQGNATITAVIPGDPPASGAVITSPTDGMRVTTTPLVVLGTCISGLEVRVFNNQALAGTAFCSTDGLFVINIGLLPGQNDLTANNYDTFGRPGPATPKVTVYVDQAEEASLGEQLVLPGANTPLPEATEDAQGGFLPDPRGFFAPLTRILGIGQSEVPVSTPQTVASMAFIGALALYATDVTLFGASFSSKLLIRLRSFWSLLRR